MEARGSVAFLVTDKLPDILRINIFCDNRSLR